MAVPGQEEPGEVDIIGVDHVSVDYVVPAGAAYEASSDICVNVWIGMKEGQRHQLTAGTQLCWCLGREFGRTLERRDEGLLLAGGEGATEVRPMISKAYSACTFVEPRELTTPS